MGLYTCTDWCNIVLTDTEDEMTRTYRFLDRSFESRDALLAFLTRGWGGTYRLIDWASGTGGSIVRDEDGEERMVAIFGIVTQDGP
jgi:hypothetical protein